MGPELTEFINEINDKYGNAYCMNDIPPDGIDFVKDEVLRAEGFWGLNRVDWIKREITAWEKALYYFCKVETEPEYVWFIEDDVFIPHIDLISEIDAKHPDADLLCKQHFSKSESPSWLGWKMPQHNLIEGPHYQSMCCAVRISRRLLMAIQDFAKEKGELIFLEFLFNTLAAKKGFKVECPKALKFIHFDEQRNYFGFNRNYMYHSVKVYKAHPLLRKNMGTPPTIHYLTIATKPHINLNRIIDMVSRNGDTISILGLNRNSDMRGFGVKLNYIKEYLKDLDDLDILLCTDAYDIILNGTLAEIQRRFVETGAKLLFGAEMGCWPDPHRQSEYKTQGQDFPYLNAGAFIGYVGIIKNILNAFNINDEIDDQRLWTDIYLKTGIITLDHSNKIFFNMFKVDTKKIAVKGRSFKYGDADPLIIHFNGDAKGLFDTVWKTMA
jgi:hypothetical protein